MYHGQTSSPVEHRQNRFPYDPNDERNGGSRYDARVQKSKNEQTTFRPSRWNLFHVDARALGDGAR